MTTTWEALAVAGFAGLGLGVGVVIGVGILRWARAESGGGRVKHRPGLHAIDDDDPPA
jgi:hypothetical protein